MTSENGVSSEVFLGDDNSLLQSLKQDLETRSKTESFNRFVAQVVPTFASKEKIVCQITLEKQHLDRNGHLHSGFAAFLTDVLTARTATFTAVNCGTASVELAVSFFEPLVLNDVVEVTTKVLKCGRSIAFAEADFRRKSDGQLAAKGRHTIALLEKKL